MENIDEFNEDQKEIINKMSQTIKNAAQSILSSIILIFRTAKKNINLGEEIPGILQDCVQQFQQVSDKWAKSKEKQPLLFKLFWCVVLIKEYARQAFQGSIIVDALNGGDAMKNLIEAIKYFRKYNQGEEGMVDNLFAKMWTISDKQCSEEIRNQIKEAFKNPNNHAALEKILAEDVFNSTPDFLKQDIENMKKQGLTENLFSSTNNYDSKDQGVMGFKVAQRSVCRMNLSLLQNGFELEKTRSDIMSVFQGRTHLTIDEFLFNFVEVFFIRHKTCDVLDEVFKKLSTLNKPELYLGDKEDVKLINEIIQMLQIKQKAGAEELTNKASVGVQVAINGEGWKFNQIIECAKKLKCGAQGSKNPLLKLQILATPTDSDPKTFPDLQLKKHILVGQEGQWYWTFGTSFLNDIILCKMRHSIGTQFVIKIEGGQLSIQDISPNSRKYETLLRAIKDKEVPLKEDDLLTLGLVVMVKVIQLKPAGISLEFVHEHQKSNVAYETTDLELDLEEEEEKEAMIGRDEDQSDIPIGHDKVSGKHCLIKMQSLIDKSTYGTYKHLRSAEQDEEGAQSGFIPFDKNLWFISLGSYDIQVL